MQLGLLARDLDTRKIVLLRRRGGIAPRGDRPLELGPGHLMPSLGGWLSVVNLRTDRTALLASKRLPKRDGELVECAGRLIDLVEPSPLLVSVASPLNLMKELFTVKGAGTLVKRGTPITRHDSYATVDVPRLKALIEASFGKALAPDYFERPILAVYLDEQYRGAAIFHPGDAAAYLSKFSVEPQAQGEGVGFDLWQAFSSSGFSAFFSGARARQSRLALVFRRGRRHGAAAALACLVARARARENRLCHRRGRTSCRALLERF